MLLGEHKAKTLEYGQSKKMYFHHLVVKPTNIDIKTSDANRGADIQLPAPRKALFVQLLVNQPKPKSTPAVASESCLED